MNTIKLSSTCPTIKCLPYIISTNIHHLMTISVVALCMHASVVALACLMELWGWWMVICYWILFIVFSISLNPENKYLEVILTEYVLQWINVASCTRVQGTNVVIILQNYGLAKYTKMYPLQKNSSYTVSTIYIWWN